MATLESVLLKMYFKSWNFLIIVRYSVTRLSLLPYHGFDIYILKESDRQK